MWVTFPSYPSQLPFPVTLPCYELCPIHAASINMFVRKYVRCILRRMPDGKDTTIALSDAVRSAISKIVTDYRELASRMRASTVAIWKLAYGGSAVRSVSADVILQLALVRDPVLLLKRLRSHSIIKRPRSATIL